MRRELLVCAVLLGLLAFRWWSWRPPAGRTRADFVRLLVAAERAGSTPRREALQQGWTDEELGRAAYHWGDLETERAVAAQLEGAPPTPGGS